MHVLGSMQYVEHFRARTTTGPTRTPSGTTASGLRARSGPRAWATTSCRSARRASVGVSTGSTTPDRTTRQTGGGSVGPSSFTPNHRSHLHRPSSPGTVKTPFNGRGIPPERPCHRFRDTGRPTVTDRPRSATIRTVRSPQPPGSAAGTRNGAPTVRDDHCARAPLPARSRRHHGSAPDRSQGHERRSTLPTVAAGVIRQTLPGRQHRPPLSAPVQLVLPSSSCTVMAEPCSSARMRT
jgi:hypothetical protein